MHCKACGYDGAFQKGRCPECNEELSLTKDEILNIKNELALALKEKEYEKAVMYYETLVGIGDTDAEREYAKLLEEGLVVPQNIERAVELYKSACFKNDAESAFKYSRYISHESVSEGSFWLIYSAMLGEMNAYVPAAKELSRMGKESEANYFFYLASNADNKEATLALAKRYQAGIGFDAPSDSYAKWQLKKFKFPPIYYIPMLFKLRKVRPEEPPKIELCREVFLRSLVRMSLDVMCDSATLYLCLLLGEMGDVNALASAGMMMVQGVGTDGETEAGLEILRDCARRGSSEAFMTLGELYREGKYVEADTEAAIKSYEMAASLERADAYEILGDMFTSGNGIERDFIRALDYYENAARLGSVKGEIRAGEIIKERNSLYERAEASTSKDEKFRLFAIASAMGHLKATTSLAECYEYGIGTDKSSVDAYNWYFTAGERGEAGALVPLGRCYADGFGVNRNFELALMVLTKASRLGDERADKLISKIYEAKKKKIAKKVYSQAMRLVHLGKSDIAVELLTLAVELEYPKAIYSLGCLYEFGMGVPTDKERAYAMYERAYSLLFRDPRSKFKLSILKRAKAKL